MTAPAPPAPAITTSAPARNWRQRLPRRTVRLRLTLLYGGLFLICGAVLLAITYVFVQNRLPVAASISGQSDAGGTVSHSAVFCAVNSPGHIATPLPLNGCATLLNQQRSEELTQLITSSGIALAIMAAVSAGLGWLVAGRVLRPLRTITTAARRISASNLNQRLALDGPDDELAELGQTFNGLLARLERAFGAQRQFVANASHELRTPLARQRTLVEVALRDPNPTVGSLQAVCERVLATGEEQERLIEALLTLARSQRGLDRREPLDLAAVTGEAVAASEPEARSRGLRVHTTLAEAPALGDARLAGRLAANLVDNAVRHNVPGGWIEVAAGLRSGRGVLSVANTGPVIPPEKVDLLFQPFGRLEAARVGRDGLGLGLSIVTAIAAAHDADLRARPLPGGGLEVEVHFPRPSAGSRPISGRGRSVAARPRPARSGPRPTRPDLPGQRAAESSGTSSSAIWAAFRAAPLRRLSPQTKKSMALGSSRLCRTRPTHVGSVPTTSAGVGNSPRSGSSSSTTPGASLSTHCASGRDTSRLNIACTATECPVTTGTRTQVADTFRRGIPRILRVSSRIFSSSEDQPASRSEPAHGTTFSASGAGNGPKSPTTPRRSPARWPTVRLPATLSSCA